MPLYLNVYGQAQQKSKFWAKNIMFWPKMAIFIGPKIFKSGSADRAHRVCHFEVSYAPLAQCIWPGLPNIVQKGAKRGHKVVKGGQFFLFSLNTMRNGVKCKSEPPGPPVGTVPF